MCLWYSEELPADKMHLLVHNLRGRKQLSFINLAICVPLLSIPISHSFIILNIKPLAQILFIEVCIIDLIMLLLYKKNK